MAARASMHSAYPLELWVWKIVRSMNAFEKGCRIMDLVRKAVEKLAGRSLDIPKARILGLSLAQRSFFKTLHWQLTTGRNIDKQFWDLRINSHLAPHLEASREVAQPLLLHRRMETGQRFWYTVGPS